MADEKVELERSNGARSQAIATEEFRRGRARRQFSDPEIATRITEVPPEPRPFSGDAPRAGFESGLIFLFFTVVYGVLGYFMLTDARIVDFVSLEHLNESYMVFWNDPPRLAAIGLDAGTFASIMFMPLSIIKPIATSLIALPILSAVAAGLLMASLNTLMRHCGINLAFRIGLLILFGLNPMVAFYAASGDPTVLGLAMLGIAMISVLAWSFTDQTRHLAAAGLAMGLAVMVDYSYILIGVGFAIAFMIIGAAKKDSQGKMRSTLLLFLTPLTYALLFWCLLNWVLLKDPFAWVTAQNGVIEVNTSGALQSIGTSFGDSLGDLFTVTLGIAPLALIVPILLIVVGILRKDATAWGLFAIGLAIAAAPVIRAVAADQANLLDLSYGLPIAVFAFGAVAWVGKGNEGWGPVAAAIMAVGLIAALPLGWNAMQDYRYQNQAQAFTRWVDTRDSQEGTESVGGYTVGIDPELAMAEYINTKIPQEKRSILVDQNFSYGVMITSGRPQNFFDRTDEGESKWQDAINNPFGKVNYMLITISRAGDQIAKKWPQAVQGGVAGLTPVFRTERYVLVEVAETKPARQTENGSSRPRTLPNPVTPSTPVNPEGPSLTTPSQSGTGSTPVSPPQSSTTPGVPTSPGTTPPSGGSSSAPGLEGE